jgi:hypothetical protein
MRAEPFELPFPAPISGGHDVVIAELRITAGHGTVDWLVHDLTAHVVFCDQRLWTTLRTEPDALTDPLGALVRRDWTLSKTTRGRCVGALVTDARGHGAPRTLLSVDVADTPYR